MRRRITTCGSRCPYAPSLPAGGKACFRYVTADGEWFDEPQADAYEANDQGGSNCVVLP